MKALSIKQPWINLIDAGHKTIETRTRPTKYRGDILLCSSLKSVEFADLPVEALDILLGNPHLLTCRLGFALCVAELYDCQPMTSEHEKAALCPVYPKAYSWFLRKIRPVFRFPVRGRLGFFEVDNQLIEVVNDFSETGEFVVYNALTLKFDSYCFGCTSASERIGHLNRCDAEKGNFNAEWQIMSKKQWQRGRWKKNYE